MTLIRFFFVFFVTVVFVAYTDAQEQRIIAVPLSHLNSSSQDHSVWAGSSFILFSSDRNSHFAGKYVENGQYFEQIYQSDRSGSKITNPKLKKLTLSGNHYDISGQSDNPAYIFIYSGQNDIGELYLIEIRPGKKSWKRQQRVFSEKLKDIRKTSVFFNEKTAELFFTAWNENDTHGGSDIYIAHFDGNNAVNSFVNAGQPLNTKGNEEGLFMIGDTLFFSSDGFSDNRNFDIYYSVRVKGEWQDPVPLATPVNSPFNDLYYVKSGSEQFFSSDRPGGMGGLDLYMITAPEKQDTTIVFKPALVLRNGYVLDGNDKSVVSAQIIIVDVETGEIADSLATTTETGFFETGFVGSNNYKIVYSAPGYETYTEVLKMSDFTTDSVIQQNIYLNRIHVHDTTKTVLEDEFSKLIATIPEKIIYYRVQVGAFRFIHSFKDFRKAYPLLDNENLIIEKEDDINKFLISTIFYENDKDCRARVTALQMKSIMEYGIIDAFIVAYTESNKRIAIIWSFTEKKYKILNQE